MSSSFLVIFVVQIFCALFGLVQSDGPPCVMCGYGGSKGNPAFTFALADVPERCDAIWYGFYCFDETYSDADKKTISDLVLAGKDVYVSVTFWNKPQWVDIMDATDPVCYAKYTDPLAKFINDNKITGIIFEGTGPFDGLIVDYATKMKSFITNLKTKASSVKVGLLLEGFQCGKYKRSDLFDFSTVNTAVDLYVIGMTTTGVECTKDVPNRYPITSNVGKVASIEEVCIDVAASAMDQTKLVTNLLVTANKMQGTSPSFNSYKDYCSRTPGNEVWCGDSIEAMYDTVTFLKKYFKGILLLSIDFDDYDDTCGCGKYPVSNAYIDAMKSVPITCCPAISGAH